MENVKVNELVAEIKSNLSQKSSSARDEIKVMKAMLNDKDFTVDVYGASGVVDTRCPAKEFRGMVSGIVSATTKIPAAEAEALVDNYECKKSDAIAMINISKDYLNTALKTGRKIPLGATANSDVSIALKEVEATTRLYPKKVGVNADGSARYEKAAAKVPAHESVKVFSPCPTWVK